MSKDKKIPQKEWTCDCGRVVMGNGRASHQSACRDYKERTLSALEEKISQIDSGVRTWPYDSPKARRNFRGKFVQEMEALREELSEMPV